MLTVGRDTQPTADVRPRQRRRPRTEHSRPGRLSELSPTLSEGPVRLLAHAGCPLSAGRRPRACADITEKRFSRVFQSPLPPLTRPLAQSSRQTQQTEGRGTVLGPQGNHGMGTGSPARSLASGPGLPPQPPIPVCGEGGASQHNLAKLSGASLIGIASAPSAFSLSTNLSTEVQLSPRNSSVV